MLRLRADVLQRDRQALISSLAEIDGVRRLTSDPELRSGHHMVSADVEPAAADNVLDALHALGLHHDDFVLVREEILTQGLRPGGLSASGGHSWVEVVGEARANARPVARYFLLMAVAGWIAGLGVIQSSAILIVGAMAVSPDLMPLCATCVGIVGRRARLALTAFATLVFGIVTVTIIAFVVGVILQNFGFLDQAFDVREINLSGLAKVDYSTGLIALGAGVAAILSFESRSAAAVGVAISVTTVPASAFFGVAVAVGEMSEARGALAVLGMNLALLVVGGTITLWFQRRFTPARYM